jgi:hypothetical protein
VKRIDCAQGSEEWLAARLGIPTASNFHRIVTPKGKLSAQSDQYMHQLIAEWALCAVREDPVETEMMQWGHDLEPQAVASYEFETDQTVEEVGFLTTDDGLIGSSPDRLVIGRKRVLEIKCPGLHTHIGYMLMARNGLDERYKPQTQGELLVSEYEDLDIQSYRPGLPTVIIRVQRDDQYIKTLEGALREFVDRMLEARAALERKYGNFRKAFQPQAAQTEPTLCL